MRAMNDSALYNSSGRAIPANAKIAISGERKPGDVLVIESFDGSSGMAYWRTAAELKSRQEKAALKADAQPSGQPPPRPRAPYS